MLNPNSIFEGFGLALAIFYVGLRWIGPRFQIHIFPLSLGSESTNLLKRRYKIGRILQLFGMIMKKY